MRSYGIIGVLLVLVVGLLSPTLSAQERGSAEVQLQAALHAEEVEGDLARAITLYKQVVAQYGGERDVAARALYYLGRSYEKQGSQEATSAYRRVVREYGDQNGVAAQARARLDALQAPAPVEGRGPVARRLLSGDDTDINNLLMMMPSPDGRRVAYVDLYVGAMHLRDLASGTDEELRPGLPAAWNWSPIWSPDGTRLAFMKADGVGDPGGHLESIQILDLASRTVTAVPGTEVTNPGTALIGPQPLAWSGDGRFLLYRTNPNGPGEIGVVPVSGGGRRAIADSVTGGSLSPDGRYVAYTAGPAKQEQVFVQPVDGGARHQVTDAPGGNTDPLWSPDGTAIAYQRSDGIWVVPIGNGTAGGAPRLAYVSTDTRYTFAWTKAGGFYLAQLNDVRVPLQVTVDPRTGAPVGAAEALPQFPTLTRLFAWSPDRARIALVVAPQAWESQAPAISVYAADGSSSTTLRVTEPGESIQQVWWSGDGQEVLFLSSVRATGTTVRALAPATGQVRDLYPRSRSRAAYHLSAQGSHTLLWDWSGMPDSSKVGWIVAVKDGPEHLVVPMTDANGVGVGQAAQLSPRGDRLLFSRQADMVATVTGKAGAEPGTLWVVGTDGTGARKIGAAHMIRRAVWDPSGRFVAYAAGVDNATTVVRIVEVATGVTHDVPLPKGSAGEPIVTDWSRDGRLVGIVAQASRWEYWAIEGLLESGR